MATELKTFVRAQVSDSETSYYTAINTIGEIRSATATNDDSSNHALSIYIVPNGGTAGAGNRIIKTLTIPAGKTRILYDLLNKQVPNGGTIQASADAASQVLLSIDGVEET